MEHEFLGKVRNSNYLDFIATKQCTLEVYTYIHETITVAAN